MILSVASVQAISDVWYLWFPFQSDTNKDPVGWYTDAGTNSWELPLLHLDNAKVSYWSWSHLFFFRPLLHHHNLIMFCTVIKSQMFNTVCGIAEHTSHTASLSLLWEVKQLHTRLRLWSAIINVNSVILCIARAEVHMTMVLFRLDPGDLCWYFSLPLCWL